MNIYGDLNETRSSFQKSEKLSQSVWRHDDAGEGRGEEARKIKSRPAAVGDKLEGCD